MLRAVLGKATGFLLFFSVLCGFVYPTVVTGITQVLFPVKANGSMIEVDGVKYGSVMLGQQFQDESHMWGRIMNIDVSTYVSADGRPLMYAVPSNLSPASEAYGDKIAARVERLQQAHPEQSDMPIPVDLVTCSGSGLDPHISPSAAQYQVKRLARENNMTEKQINQIIDQCTTHRFIGFLGEETVNVLKVNLYLEGILT